MIHNDTVIPLKYISGWSSTKLIIIFVVLGAIAFVVALVVIKFKRDEYLLKDLKEFGVYLKNRCRRPEDSYLIDLPEVPVNLKESTDSIVDNS